MCCAHGISSTLLAASAVTYRIFYVLAGDPLQGGRQAVLRRKERRTRGRCLPLQPSCPQASVSFPLVQCGLSINECIGHVAYAVSSKWKLTEAGTSDAGSANAVGYLGSFDLDKTP